MQSKKSNGYYNKKSSPRFSVTDLKNTRAFLKKGKGKRGEGYLRSTPSRRGGTKVGSVKALRGAKDFILRSLFI